VLIAVEAPMTSEVHLRDVMEGDLSIFFEQQLDSAANQMDSTRTHPRAIPFQ